MDSLIGLVVTLFIIRILCMLLLKLVIYGSMGEPRTPKTPDWLNVLIIFLGIVSGAIIGVGYVCKYILLFLTIFWQEIIQPAYRASIGGVRRKA